MESGWNTQFDTNCGRLPAAFRAGKHRGVCHRSRLSLLCIENPLMRDDMDKEQKNPDVLLCVHRDFP